MWHTWVTMEIALLTTQGVIAPEHYFRAIANNLELLNFAMNFYIYCLCSAEIRRSILTMFKQCFGVFRSCIELLDIKASVCESVDIELTIPKDKCIMRNQYEDDSQKSNNAKTSISYGWLIMKCMKYTMFKLDYTNCHK